MPTTSPRLPSSNLAFTAGIIGTLSFLSKQVERTTRNYEWKFKFASIFDTAVQQQAFELSGGMPRPSLRIASPPQGRLQAVVRRAFWQPVIGPAKSPDKN